MTGRRNRQKNNTEGSQGKGQWEKPAEIYWLAPQNLHGQHLGILTASYQPLLNTGLDFQQDSGLAPEEG